ncbi:MAG: hypothetical protein HFG68_10885 [Hungatella sp.]|nr:hypothetical protein [Hungatella sp.]
MKNKMMRIISLTLIIMLIGANTAFASDLQPLDVKTYKEVNDSVEPRSLYLASAISEITNEGNGVLHIYADFLSHQSVKWAKLTINLERTKGESSGSWSTVKTYTREFYEEDQSDGELVFGCADFDVSGYATGYYYRLTCEHKVKTPSGSYETKTTRTNGVLLTSYPDFRSIGNTN